jgi:predicted PurR-regulated permease PerM
MDDLESRNTPEETEQPSPPAPAPQEQPADKRLRKRTIFYISATVAALLILIAAFHEPLTAVIKYIFSILSPLTIGLVIAYLCDPILEFYEYRLLRRMPKGNGRRGLALLLTVLTAFGILAVVGAMMIPQLIESINELFKNYEVYLNGLLSWINDALNRMTENLHVEIVDFSDVNKFMAFLEDVFGSAENAVSQLLTKLQEFATEGNLLEKTWALLLELFNSFKNLLLGIFIAFYFLASKEKRVAQFAKFRRAMFKEKTDKRIEEIITLTDKSFGGFIYGKINK